ncbi:efflux RND transporter periplasmic adaptor subunit [Schlesneria paludicola]|uniref:efflux RND transporter periplasmic adaptor subunit n=1 Tax=Schlesneria paludicola TaxID=360056 RepID=UPI00029AB82A|nr:efflux RND transporter periplasmic adaptor subunit [Schlesneria paludicola]
MILIRKSLVVFGCSSLGLLLSGCSESHPDATGKLAAMELPKVATVKPQRKTLIQKTAQPGHIDAFHATPMFAKVGGYVEQFYVDIGDSIQGPKFDESGRVTEPGQLMALLEAPELKEELQQKNAIVAQGLAEVEQSEAAVKVARSLEASAMSIIEERHAGQRRAKANVERWKSEFDRVRDLAEKKAVTQKLADESDQQYKSAEASLAEENAKLRSAEAKYQEVVVAIQKAQADVKTAMARVDVAKSDRDRVAALCRYLEIRAPYTGVVTTRDIDQGVLILAARSANELPLFTVMQADKVRIFVDVPESDAVLVELGQPVSVKVPAMGAKAFAGTVARTGWALQAGTRTLNCEIDIANPDGVLRPGMYTHVELIVAQRENALSIPKSAIVVADGQSVCFTVSADGVVERRPVQLGIRTDTDVEVVSGLDEAEAVISTNVSAFREGQKVTPPTN